MPRRPQFNLRKLIVLIAVLAVVLAVVRSPYLFVRSWQRLNARTQEGQRLIQTYRALCPPEIGTSQWGEAVNVVGIAWGNVVFSPDSIAESDLDGVLAELRQLVAPAMPRPPRATSTRSSTSSPTPGHGRPSTTFR
jgi:hypothetical protein